MPISTPFLLRRAVLPFFSPPEMRILANSKRLFVQVGGVLGLISLKYTLSYIYILYLLRGVVIIVKTQRSDHACL